LEFIVKDTKIITCNNLVEYDLENFLIYMAGSSPLLWCDGYFLAFSRYDIKTYEKNIEENSNRIFDSIVYCKHPDFERIVYDEQKIAYAVLNDSKNKFHKDFVKLLKERND
jgi:hypothetical protein